MRVSLCPIFYQYQDLYLSLLTLKGNFNKNYRLLEMLYRWKKYKNHADGVNTFDIWNIESDFNFNPFGGAKPHLSGRVGELRSGLTLSKPRHLCRGAEGLTYGWLF